MDGVIEVDLFEKEVNDIKHPDVMAFKMMLEDVAEEYDCSLTVFEISHGTVCFAFDSDILMAEILGILKEPLTP